MAATGDDLSISGAVQLDENSCPKRRISRVVPLIRMVLRLFPFPVALLFVAVTFVEQTSKFVLLKLADSGVLDTPHRWISVPPVMFILVNIVIVTLGIKSGVFSSPAGNESTRYPFIEVHFHRIAEIEDCSLNDYPQEECHLDPEPTMEFQSSTLVLCEKLQDFKCTAPSMCPMKYLLSDAEEENFVKNSDTAMLGSSHVEYRVLNSPILTNTVNERFDDCLASSPSLFFIDVSHGKAEMDVEFENDRPKHDEDWNADELFLKSEDFIENFKRQLRIQRENSWKRLCEIYTESC